jgi:hypothetical protein
MGDDVTVERKKATLTCDDGTKLTIEWNVVRTRVGDDGAVFTRHTSPRFEIGPSPAPTGETPR